MKPSKRLKQALRAIANPASQMPREWQLAHPVTSGLVPLVNYVPPSGHGNSLTPKTPNYENTVEANLARVSCMELAN